MNGLWGNSRVPWRSRLLAALPVPLVLLVLLLVPTTLGAQSPLPPWYQEGTDGPLLHLYYFGSPTCPHCRAAQPFLDGLERELPWLRIHRHQVNQPDARERLEALGRAVGERARGVPAFFYCRTLRVGYDDQGVLGGALRQELHDCRQEVASALAGGLEPLAATRHRQATVVSLPWGGAVDALGLTLPALTVLLGGLDAFNPCAFFVLLFLLSLLTHLQQRGRILLVGGVFVLCSGVVYFLFMAAWLNLFLVTGGLTWITAGAGTVALVMGALNVRDFHRSGQAPALAIPEAAKPRLYQRIRRIIQAGGLPAMLGATVVLALAANSYELLCTAGFPMVFTRVLTLHHLPMTTYYLYLAAYNLVYVLPLMAIVAVFARRLHSRKLSEREGRILKLLSGVMMSALGLTLLLAPQWLHQAWAAVALLAGALLVTGALLLVHRPPPP